MNCASPTTATGNSSETSRRQAGLDGVRGVGALIVVIFHFLSAFEPGLVPDQSANVPWPVDTPLGVLMNGPFAVFVFFVLSGFVLAQSSARRTGNLLPTIAGRYCRLAFPAVMSVLLGWALLNGFATSASSLDAIHPSPWLRWTYQSSIPGLAAALKDGLFGVFISGESLFNNVLWTMKIELLGSIGIFVFFAVILRYRMAAMLAALAGMVLLHAHAGYFAFASGCLLFLARSAGWRIGPLLGATAFIVGVLLGSMSTGFAARHGLTWLPNTLQPGNRGGFLYPAAAAMVVAGVLYSATVEKLFRNRFCQFLGYISFPLYLVHVPILYTLGTAAALSAHAYEGPRLAALAAGLLATAICLALIFERSIDRWALRLNRALKGKPGSRHAGEG